MVVRIYGHELNRKRIQIIVYYDQEVREMIFSSNENLFINMLNYKEYISAKKLAETLFVSTKTIYRIAKKINELSQNEFNQTLIISEPGKGYKLNTYFINRNFHSMIDFKEENELNELVLSLLFKHPTKISRKYFKQQYISESTEERQIKKIHERLLDFGIKLESSKDYLWLSGKEIQIRKAINYIFSDLNKLNSLGEIGIEINAIDKHFIDSQIALIEDVVGEYINYPYDITLYTHIYMLIKRYREGEVEYLDQQEPLEADEKQLMEHNPAITAIAEKIVENIQSYLSITLNPLENYFVFQNLYSINIQKRECSNVDKRLAEEITTELITKFFSLSNITLLPASRSLYEDLYQHILPMLSRLRLGIQVENNLLNEVILEYRETFLKLKTIIVRINQELVFDTKINEAEIGYITLYFEKYKVNRNNKKNLLLVCSTGVGTSELLKVRVQQNFPNLNIIATMSQRQLKNNQEFVKENIDLIFSTLKMPINIDSIPTLTISPLLNGQDIQKINYTLKEM